VRSGRRTVGGHEPGDEVPPGQQQLRIEVGGAAADAEVQGGAARADDGVVVHHLAGVDGHGRQVRVRGAQPVGVEDGDEPLVADGAGERHHPGRARVYRRAGREGVVDAAVARAPRARGRTEVVDDRAVGGRPVDDARPGDGRAGEQPGGEGDGDAGHEGTGAMRQSRAGHCALLSFG
jgi:hypothetical protein